jgi:putative tryptophan/tyrosine transport system substrate-binding protein
MNRSKQAGMGRKTIVILLLGLTLASVRPVEAQQPGKVPRIGVLRQSSAHVLWTQLEAFRQGLRDRGYLDGQNIVIEYRYAEGELDRLPSLANELVRINVDVIVVSSTPAVLAAKNATKEIPIVFHTIGDPVGSGLVANLARPGGNVTGLTMGGAELYGKRLELLKETIPKLSQAAILWNPTSTGIQQNVKETQAAAQVLKLQIQSLEIRNPGDIELAFETAIRSKTGAILVTQSPPITTHPKRIIDIAVKRRLPVIYPQGQWPDMGGLMSYGANVEDSYRYLASYVDKILKGSKPADLPVERSRKLELVINLKAAKQIGLTIPPNVLARADKVIK